MFDRQNSVIFYPFRRALQNVSATIANINSIVLTILPSVKAAQFTCTGINFAEAKQICWRYLFRTWDNMNLLENTDWELRKISYNSANNYAWDASRLEIAYMKVYKMKLDLCCQPHSL